MTSRKKAERVEGSFEESLRRLEEIVDRLEQGEVPLDDAIHLYEQGIKLSQECARKLNAAEITLKRLGKDLNGNLTLLEDDPDE